MSPKELFESYKGKPLKEVNSEIEGICGIVDFFDSGEYTLDLGDTQVNKVEFGDWQTNFELAVRVCLLIKEKGISPQVAIEPTCGTGTFILAAAIVFAESLDQIFGIEIYKPYINQLKYRFLEYGLSNPGVIRCKIKVIHQSIFGFDFTKLGIPQEKNVLLIGNPPWVTNSKLGEINSDNLPQKSNFKNVKGLDAITGKGNFDIAEYITYQLLDAFNHRNACLAFLIKSSVAKNIVYEQKKGKYNISKIVQYNIDAKKEFDVSVAACLFFAQLGTGTAQECEVKDFYNPAETIRFGWVNDSFVSNVDDYSESSYIDGKCQITWWSGLKHDCAKVMELESKDGVFYNKLKEVVDIEDDLVYPMLKSSDIKDTCIEKSRKYVIITQQSTSDDTARIRRNQPKTYAYLTEHDQYFEKRGSIIYKNRPKFCIFGIGPYSFQKYKIAIAGLYKSTTFSLVMPINGKCTMLDDTCYLMGFDELEKAECFLKVLNSDIVQKFMKAIVFNDAKRSINKDALMRIDLLKAAQLLSEKAIITQSEYDIVKHYINSRSGCMRTEPSLFGNEEF